MNLGRQWIPFETGNFDSDDYFQEKKIGVFAGTVYKIDNGQLTEYNSFDSSSKFGVVKELAKFNLGYAYLGSDRLDPVFYLIQMEIFPSIYLHPSIS